MNPKLKNLFIKVRDFVQCCKKTTTEIDSMPEDLSKIHSENQPKLKPSDKREGG